MLIASAVAGDAGTENGGEVFAVGTGEQGRGRGERRHIAPGRGTAPGRKGVEADDVEAGVQVGEKYQSSFTT
jgi:hypothetical protein